MEFLEEFAKGVDSIPAGWSMLMLAAALFAWAFRFRFARIARRQKSALRTSTLIHESETNISPINYAAEGSNSEYVREWLKNADWLQAHWRLEEKMIEAIRADGARSWRFIPTEQRDIEYLERRGVTTVPTIHRKGQLYDLLGLCEMPTALQAQQLRYFDVKNRLINRTIAEREVRWLMESKTNRMRWETRPIDDTQAIFFKIMDVTVLRQLTASQAQEIIFEILERGGEGENSARSDWFAFESIYTDLSTEHSAATRGIRLPGAELVFSAFEKLRKEGVPAIDQYIEMDVVVKKLLQLEPQLRL